MICVAVCGAQADVILANDTDSKFNAGGARGQLRGAVKGNETSAINLRSGMAATEYCDIAAEYRFDQQVAIGSNCTKSACQETVEAVPKRNPLRMVGVLLVLEKYSWCTMDVALRTDHKYGFKVYFECVHDYPWDVTHSGTMVSAYFGWQMHLRFSAKISDVHLVKHGWGELGAKGELTISTDASSSPYIESVSLRQQMWKKPQPKEPELAFGDTTARNIQCITSDTCIWGPAVYMPYKSSHPFKKISHLQISPPGNGATLCASGIP